MAAMSILGEESIRITVESAVCSCPFTRVAANAANGWMAQENCCSECVLTAETNGRFDDAVFQVGQLRLEDRTARRKPSLDFRKQIRQRELRESRLQ